MAKLFPFRALRPAPEAAAHVASVPYDVVNTEEARALVRTYKDMGADGIKVSKGPGHYPDVIAAICEEVKTLGMNGVAVDLKVSETDALIASNAGVTSIEHWYGIPDAAIPGTQRFPAEYEQSIRRYFKNLASAKEDER